MKKLFNYKFKSFLGFTLVELLVVVAIVGVLATVGIFAYNRFIEITQKNATKQNFVTTVNAIKAEMARCKLDTSAVAFGMPCPIKVNSTYQACMAIYLSWKHQLRNPTGAKEAAGWTASAAGRCATVVTGDVRGGVRSGDGQKDGDVNIVYCPRSPYCGNEAKGKFKIMWWWDGNKMQDHEVIAIF